MGQSASWETVITNQMSILADNSLLTTTQRAFYVLTFSYLDSYMYFVSCPSQNKIHGFYIFNMISFIG
jgi:hypothetical protein